MSNLSRREFIKGIAASAVSVGVMGMAACGKEAAAPAPVAAPAPDPAVTAAAVEKAVEAKKMFTPGTYTSTQMTEFATVEVKCDIAADGLTKVAYEVLESKDGDFFAAKKADVDAYCSKLVDAGSTVGVEGISGATLCTTAVKDGVNECLAQALGIDLTAAQAPKVEGPVLNPQDYSYTKNTITDFSKSALFSDWKLGPFTFNHRMVKSAAFQLCFMRGIKDEYINYYKRMADGGVQMIWAEDFANMWDLTASPMKQNIDAYDVKAFLDTLHERGCKVGYQFDTMGAPIGPLTFEKPFIGDYDTATIKEWVKVIIGIGVKLKELGFDAYELNFAANNLGQSFFSRARNNRTDEYGPQTLESRCKFAEEVITGIKAACGKDFVVQVLINGVEENDSDLGNNDEYNTIEETIAIAKKLEAAGADSLHVRIGPQGEHITQFAGDLYFAARGFEGYNGFGKRFDFDKHFEGLVRGNNSGVGINLDIAAKIKAAVNIPVGCATYNDPALAPDLFDDAIKQGKVDFLVMNRPLCVDPEYVNKLREGRIDEIAPCTRCLHCFFDNPYDMCNLEHCRVNAASFRAYSPSMPEGFDPLPAASPKKVMVIGAGPAGMEAARIAADRGHSVTLYDKNAAVGSMLTFAESVKGPHENLGRLRDYLKRKCELSGVKLVLNKEVDAAFIKSEAPDYVILATGGKRDTLNLKSTAKTNVISIDDVLGGSIGENVVVLGSNAQSVDAALYLLSLGKKVTVVTPSAKADFEKGHSVNMKEFLQPTFFAVGGKLFPNAKVSKVGDGFISFTAESGLNYDLACDTVVEALDMLPDTSMIDGLGIDSIAVGDCILPLNIAHAIASGNVAARNI